MAKTREAAVGELIAAEYKSIKASATDKRKKRKKKK